MIELKLIILIIERIITIFELDESLLEQCEVKASRTVLRRVWGSNSSLLSDSTIKILIGGEQNMIFPLSRFIQRLKDKFKLYKPEADGVQFVKPHNTSRTCHHCGYIK